MKRFLIVCGAMFVTCMAQATPVQAAANSEPSSYLLVLAGVALIGTIAHRRNKAKSRM